MITVFTKCICVTRESKIKDFATLKYLLYYIGFSKNQFFCELLFFFFFSFYMKIYISHSISFKITQILIKFIMMSMRCLQFQNYFRRMLHTTTLYDWFLFWWTIMVNVQATTSSQGLRIGNSVCIWLQVPMFDHSKNCCAKQLSVNIYMQLLTECNIKYLHENYMYESDWQTYGCQFAAN